jgi:hypothetical protein
MLATSAQMTEYQDLVYEYLTYLKIFANASLRAAKELKCCKSLAHKKNTERLDELTAEIETCKAKVEAYETEVLRGAL